MNENNLVVQTCNTTSKIIVCEVIQKEKPSAGPPGSKTDSVTFDNVLTAVFSHPPKHLNKQDEEQPDLVNLTKFSHSNKRRLTLSRSLDHQCTIFETKC